MNSIALKNKPQKSTPQVKLAVGANDQGWVLFYSFRIQLSNKIIAFEKNPEQNKLKHHLKTKCRPKKKPCSLSKS